MKTNNELANEYRKKGYYTTSTKADVRADILKLRAEIEQADKRTYNGKMTRTFNNARIAIANIILADLEGSA